MLSLQRALESDCWSNDQEKEVLEALEDYTKGRKWPNTTKLGQRVLSLKRALESDCWSNHPEKEVLEALKDYKEGRKRASQRRNRTEGSYQEGSSSKISEEGDN